MKYAIGKPFAPNSSTIGGDFIIPSAVSTGGSIVSGWPVDNVRDEHLQRSARWTTGGTRTVVFTISSQIPAAVFVEGVNVSTIQVTSGGGHSSGNLTCDLNPRTGRYSRYYEPTSGSSTTWTVTMNNAVVTGDSFIECGRISMVKAGSLKTMPAAACWGQPFNLSVDSLGGEQTMAGGEAQTAGTSLSFIRLDLQGLFYLTDSAQTTHPYAFSRMKRDERVMLFENRSSDTNKVYCHLLRRVGEATISEEFPHLDISVPMQEVI